MASAGTALMMALTLARPASSQGLGGTWSPIPPPQIEPRLFACDSLRDRLLFQTKMGAIWSFSLDDTKVWSVLDPSAPTGEPFYDPIRDRLIVIGRTAGSTLVASRSLASGAWDSLQIAGLPPPAGDWRVPGLMVYDAARNRVVMFGTTDIVSAFPSFISFSNETWILPLDGTPEWTRIFPTGTPPSGRRNEAAIFDPVRVQLVLFGGDDKSSTLPRDTWELTLGDTIAWKHVLTAGLLPQGRINAGTVYDPVGDQMIMYAGTALDGSVNDPSIWTLPLSAPPEWTPLPVDLLDLSGQRTPFMVFDPRRSHTIIAGVSNENGGTRSATSGWSLTYYPQFNPPAYLVANLGWPDQPPLWAREYAAGAYDGIADQMLVFGGSFNNNGTFGLGDTWSLPLASPQWAPLDPVPFPVVPPGSTQLYASMVLDPIRHRLLRFDTPTADQTRTYTMDLANPQGWVPVGTGGVIPFGRDYPSLVYDPVHDRVLMFGGFNPSFGVPYYTNEIQALSLDGTPTWSLIAPSGTPPAGRNRAVAVYDSIGDRLVVHGGTIYDSPGLATDTWVCAFAGSPAWQPLNPSGEPPLRVFGNETNAAAIYDPLRSRMVVIAPESLGVREGAWELSLGPSPAWTHLELDGPAPSARFGISAVYAARRDAAVMFGGRSVSLANPDLNDTWFLDFPPVVLPDATCPGDIVWVQGSNTDFDVTVTSTIDQTADYQLTSQRAWPGFPITGTVNLLAGTPIQVPFSAPVPDSAAIGLNALAFRITPRGGAATAVCSFHIHDASTPTLTVLVSAVAGPGEVRLTWFAPDEVGAWALERRTSREGWQAIASVTPDGSGYFLYIDRQVSPGERYGYRVRSPQGGASQVSPETWVDVPPGARLALAGLQPNPAGGRISVAFTLPDAAPARLELVDVGGRRVLDRPLDGLGPGVHSIDLDEAGILPAGIYFVRLTHGHESLTRRGVIVR